ncbi:MAG TPA: tetratricopeptide repeat protein, partial [Thermoanaerobaculia bacterium]|nr:tetratricopeptide repeat protein [Thermoanaerobaculia bacterium]
HVVADEETRELITINKADAMIAIERSGPEVQALPTIVMRRRNLRHVYLAAYALVFKYRMEKELKRAAFYGQLALQTAQEANEALWKIGALNELASIYDADSKFAQAIECGEQAIALIEQLDDPSEHRLAYGLAVENLGASKLLNDDLEEGIALIEKAMPFIAAPMHLAEANIDLCFGYLGLEKLDEARRLGEAALELASEPRQIRNAHYLLGEVAYKLGDIDLAEFHFDKLAAFYPDFRHLKSLLFAIDLRSMVNLKL